MATFNGTPDNDTLTGTGGNDTLNGLGLADTLRGLGGADVLNGGDYYDTADYSASPAGVRVDVFAGTATGGHAQGDTLLSIENLIGSAFDDLLVGDIGSNQLWGGDGNDTLRGAGNFFGGAGADSIEGTGGSAVYYNDSPSGVTVNLTMGTGSRGDAEGDVLSGITRIFGGPFSDALTGDAADNVIVASDGPSTGNDTLRGMGGDDGLVGSDGNDLLNGGRGADFMEGGLGDDIYHVDNPGDEIMDPQAGDQILATISYTTPGFNLTLIGSADINGTGNSGANFLQGNGGANVLDGKEESDTLKGAAGQDTLFGGIGDDRLAGGPDRDLLDGGPGRETMNGGAGSDTVSYELGASSGVTVNLSIATPQVTGGAGADMLSNIEGIVGSVYGDRLTGNAGRNVLNGLAGSDRLNGNQGNDTLMGGGGRDSFVFDSALDSATNVDRLADFSSARDAIRLDDEIFLDMALGTLASSRFHAAAGATEASDRSDRIVYDSQTGRLYHDPDGAGGTDSTLFAILTDAPAITAPDFIVIG